MSELLRQTYLLHAHHWQCEPPGRNQLATAALEAECGIWCRKLVAALPEPTFPPPHVQPWVLLRLKCALGHAQLSARLEPTAALGDLRDMAAGLLVEFWPQISAALRDRLS